MAWRKDTRAYYIVVSEIMLQQTQVERVKVKFAEFISAFPDWQALAHATQTEVLSHWQGLGYNRRALFLHKTAQRVVTDYHSQLPDHLEQLKELPGIGPGTAGAISAFAFNLPVIFIETNIRRVFLHHFFEDKRNVADKDIFPLLEECIPQLQDSMFEPRTYYWALMDYGTHLKNTLPNPNKRSAHYSVQSKFEGSNRQLRGKILKALLASSLELSALQKTSEETDNSRFNTVITQLESEGFIVITKQKVTLR